MVQNVNKISVAVLYICTGKYNQFFSGFYDSAEKYFLKGLADIQYFVFTDELNLGNYRSVHVIPKQCQGFPLDSLLRFEMFTGIKDTLLEFDYVFFFNANTEFKQKIGKEVLPMDKVGLVAAEWPGKMKPFKSAVFFPYERNKKSLAYIPPFENKKYKYYMGGVNGGKAVDYIKMIETLSKNIRDDYERGIIARVHDESHINKYLRDHDCICLSEEYCWPEEWKSDFTPKIIFRDKVKIDKYFNKGRSQSFYSKIKKTILLFYRAITWFF